MLYLFIYSFIYLSIYFFFKNDSRSNCATIHCRLSQYSKSGKMMQLLFRQRNNLLYYYLKQAKINIRLEIFFLFSEIKKSFPQQKTPH